MLYDLILLVGALAGQLLDATLTALLVTYAGGREINPLVRPIAGKFLLLAAVKIAVIGITWHYADTRFLPSRRYSMRVLAIGGWAATLWNAAWGAHALARLPARQARGGE